MMDEKIMPEERMKCPACGRTVSQRWDFCPKCRYCLVGVRTAGSASDTRFYVKELFETDDPAVVTDKLQNGNWIVLAVCPRNGKNIFRLGRIS